MASQRSVHRVLSMFGVLLIAALLTADTAAAPTRGPNEVELVLDLKGFAGPVRDVAFSPHGTLLAACGQREVRLWDLRTGQLLRTLRGQVDRDGYGECLAVAFSHDDCELVVGIRGHGKEGALRVYDIRDIAEIKELIAGFSAPVAQLTFARDGRWLAVASEDGRLTIYDWPLRRVVGSTEPSAGRAAAFSRIRFPSADPLLLASGPAGTTVWSVPGCQALPPDRPLPAALARWLQGQARLERPLSGAIAASDWRLEHNAFLAGGSGKTDAGEQHWVGLWTGTATAPATVYGNHRHKITAVALNSACTLAASADVRGEVHVWDAQTGASRYVLRSVGRPVFRAAADAGFQRLGFTTTPLPPGEQTWNQYGVIDRAFALDRRTVSAAVAGEFSGPSTSSGGQLSATQRPAGFGLRLVTPQGTAADIELAARVPPTCFALLPAGRLGSNFPVVVGDQVGNLFGCDPIRGPQRQTFVGHQSFITSLSESADGRFLTTSSTDHTIRIWNLAGTAADRVDPVLNLLIAGDGQWILWTPQGYYDASPGGGDLLGWHVNRGPERSAAFYPVHLFRRQLYRPDIVQSVLPAGSAEAAVQEVSRQEPIPGAPPASPAPLTTDLRQAPTMHRLQPPRVRILSPQDGLTTREGQVHVLAEIVAENDLPITDVRVLVNGRPGLEKGVSVLSGEGPDPRRISFSRAASLLPGDNQISVLASNGMAASVPVTVRVSYEAPAKVLNVKPNLHLLAIGISEYQKKQLNLRFAHQDAQAFAAAWESQRGTVYENVSTTLLLNEAASATRVRAAIDQLVQSVARQDIAVIFISAHGIRDRQLEYYLATHDIDPDNLAGTGLHFSVVTRLLEALPCKVLLFVDTCHAAGITGAKSVWRDPLYELTSDEYGAIVFSSSLSREISVEDEKWGHGAFTKAILETFAQRTADLNGDGFLSLTEIEQSVCDRVQDLTQGQQHPVMKRPATVHNIPIYRVGKA